jgi:FMN phosphatase YigB (HAD superfamily)
VQQCNLNPEKTLFIDDSLQNVEGAINAGLPAYYLKPPERLSDIAIHTWQLAISN